MRLKGRGALFLMRLVPHVGTSAKKTFCAKIKIQKYLISGSARRPYQHINGVRCEMKLSNHSTVPVYTISGSSTARPLPEWLARRRKRSLKADSEYSNRVELLQDFEFEEASQCIRVSEDGQWVMSTGMGLTSN